MDDDIISLSGDALVEPSYPSANESQPISSASGTSSSLITPEQQVQPEPIAYLFNITLEGFKHLVSEQIDLNAIYVLDGIRQGVNIPKEIKSSKVAAWYQSLLRKSYIIEVDKLPKITEAGLAVLESVRGGHSVRQTIQKIEYKEDSDFLRWWKTYPSTAQFTYKGKKFLSDRGLKVDKDVCQAKFTEILAEGIYTVDELIHVLKYEVWLKKEASIRENENKMKWMSGSPAYLNQNKYEAFMQDSKSWVEPIENNINNNPINTSNNSTSQYSGFDL